MDGHLPSLGGSPANPRMVTHQPKIGHLVWPFLGLFDTIWPGLPMFGNFCSGLSSIGPILPYVLPSVRPCLALFGPG